MGRDLDLKRRLELAGLEVIEVYGWQERGSSNFAPRGSVNHHTAGPRTGYAPSLGIVINGRSDLPGPLANTYGAREESLRVHLVAAGRANHAGSGGWRGLQGNSSVYGHEEEHCGYPDEPLSPLRYDRMVRVHAAFAFRHHSPENVCQHWEWTSRKIDFVKAHIDPNRFRRDVARRLALMEEAASRPAPPPIPAPIPATISTEDNVVIGRKNHNWRIVILHDGTAFAGPDEKGSRDPDIVLGERAWKALVDLLTREKRLVRL